MEKLKTKLAAQGIDPDRLQLAWISATEGRAFQQLIQEMTEKLADLNAGIFIRPDTAPDSSGPENDGP